MAVNPVDFSRRDFLKTSAVVSGGLLIAIALPGCKPGAKASGETKFMEPNAWLRIGTDDTITFYCDKSEMGQGVYTSLTMLVAEELGVFAQPFLDRSDRAGRWCGGNPFDVRRVDRFDARRQHVFR